MKRYTIMLVLILAIGINGCKKKELPPPKVDNNGLTKNITDLVPQSVLDEMKRLGMPINGGENPPNIENTYWTSPFILVSSNRANDVIGHQFADYKVTFHDQNNDDLTVHVDYENGPESGFGIGSFIVGNDCKFSVFVNIKATYLGDTARVTHVISGIMTDNGIVDLYFANFMIDNYGNPNNIFIENGEGRVIKDNDGFSEIYGTTANWYASLPPCPCTYNEAKSMPPNCLDGEWQDCGSASSDYHYGASYEVRWLPHTSGKPGQQCTYSRDGGLITGGIAAGSPDKVSPRACGFWTWLLGGSSTSYADYQGHKANDIQPWEQGNPQSVPCWTYLEGWQANNKNNCTPNIVSGIQHMRTLVGDMTCEEVTLLIRKAKESPNLMIDNDLRNYILGQGMALSNAQLIAKLQNWKSLQSCNMFPTEPLCLAIDKAITNLQ